MLYKLVSVDVVYEACHLFVPLHIILCLFYGTFLRENVVKLGRNSKASNSYSAISPYTLKIYLNIF